MRASRSPWVREQDTRTIERSRFYKPEMLPKNIELVKDFTFN
jgi:hypothetical protein